MYDSDTESEPDNSLPKWNAADFALNAITQVNHKSRLQDGEKSVQQAIKILSSIDVQSIIQDETRHCEIGEASSTILLFLNNLMASEISLDKAPDEAISTLSAILDEAFISLLLDYRRVFHIIAAQQVPTGTATSSIICWVDVILSQITAVVILGTTEKVEFVELKKQREDDTLRAVAQLPYEWKNILGVIGSENASPAASRVALRLAFAVHVVGERSTTSGSCSAFGKSDHLQTVLNAYIGRVSFSRHTGPTGATSIVALEMQLQERLNYAMLLGLYCTTENRSSNSTFRPHTSAILLRYIQHILHPNSKCSDSSLITELDLPQRLLLRWGNVVFWSLVNWQDERIVGFESIVFLTATWIFHAGKLENSPPWELVIKNQLHKDPNATSVAIVMLLRQIIQDMTSYSATCMDAPTAIVLYKAVWTAAHLLDPSNGWDISTSAALAQCLFGLFVLVQDIEQEEDVKDLLLQGLTSVPGDAAEVALADVRDDNRINFVMKIDLAMSSITRSLTNAENTLELGTTTAARQMLIFLAIIWNSCRPGCFHREIVSSFFSTLIERISSQGPKFSTLKCSLLTTLTSLQNKSDDSEIINKVWEDEKIWLLAMSSDPTDLMIASAFANYVTCSAKNKKCDPLCFAEAWDHFRDCLLLVLTHHFLGDQEPLALLVVGSICQALSSLLQYADLKAGTFILSSPWTISLCDNLKTVLESTDQEDTYVVVLRDRLSVYGSELQSRVEKLVCPNTAFVEVPQTTLPPKLMLCQIDLRPSYLIMIPQ